jgi:hypothetical protein
VKNNVFILFSQKDDQIWPTYAQPLIKSSHNLNDKWQKINFYQIEIENEIKSVEKLKNLIGFVSPSNWIEGTKNGFAEKTILDSTIEKLQEIVTQKFVSINQRYILIFYLSHF